MVAEKWKGGRMNACVYCAQARLGHEGGGVMPIGSQELLKRNHQAISELLRREIASNTELDKMDLDRICGNSRRHWRRTVSMRDL
jgi:hypothetical protein